MEEYSKKYMKTHARLSQNPFPRRRHLTKSSLLPHEVTEFQLNHYFQSKGIHDK